MARKDEGKRSGIIVRFLKRYFIDALSSMALGLFSSLIIGLILSQLGKIPYMGFLAEYAEVLSASSPVVGAAIGVAIAYGLGVCPLAIFSCAAVGAYSYLEGGPVGCYAACVIAAELGNLIGGRTKLDIVLVPIVTIVSGGIVGQFVGPYINQGMVAIGNFINTATQMHPIPMGILVSASMGMILTAPISSAAIAISLDLSGLAAGAATVGCCAQMVGFAVASYRENGVGGLFAQGLGTSMLQVGNIVRNPLIWVAPTLAGAILGPLSTTVFKMTNTAAGAGMGTSGLVGQFGTWAAMSADSDPLLLMGKILVLHFVLPAVLTLAIDTGLRKIGWVKAGDMSLDRS